MILNAKPGRNRVAAGVYGLGICAMFSASGAYHRLTKSRKMASVLRRIDHSMIYVMIAGTWTPIAVATLPPNLVEWVSVGACVVPTDADAGLFRCQGHEKSSA